MATKLPRVKPPAWLTKLSADSMKNDPFPLDRILRGSLFYPASGFDDDPIRHLSGSVRSFVYADYGLERDEFMRALDGPEFHCPLSGLRPGAAACNAIVPAGRKEMTGPAGCRTGFGRQHVGQMQFPEHGPLFGLVRMHPPQDVIQNPHGADDIGSLVEHDALGAETHRGVRDLGARWPAFPGKGFQDLGGPDHGDMRSLAEP